MADFVTKEKEFRKLNEKLDDDFKRSTTLSKVEKFKETRQNPLTSICYDTYRVKREMGGGGGGVGGGNNDRFATYTKEKCTAAALGSMRKVGGGDSVAILSSKPKSPTSPKKSTKSSYGNTFTYRAKSLPKGATGGGGCGGGLLVKDTLERKQQKSYADEQNNSKTATTPTLTQTSTRKLAPKEALIVYKNNKFTCSSSMDDIIKRNLTENFELVEENNDGRATVQSSRHNSTLPPRAESTLPLESLVGSSTGKSSQKIVNTSSLIRFLKSKVALLEENQARNMEEMSQQKEAYESMLERHKSITQQLEKALNRQSSLTEQLDKANTQLNESNRRLREQNQECLTLKRELETIKRELKHLTLNYTNLEKRYARTKEEAENVQKSCSSMRQGERDLKENFRRETEAKNAEIKYLKKQRSDLFTAYKKQLFLIDNLRQQNLCMEQAKMIDFCEKEFSKILEWNLKA